MSHTFFGPLKEKNVAYFFRTAQEEECRIPFFGPLKGACPSLCPQKGKTTFFSISVTNKMQYSSFNIGLWFSCEVTLHPWAIHAKPGFVGS